MIQTSEAFGSAVEEDVRTVCLRFLLEDGTALDGAIQSVEIHKGTGCENAFLPGALYSSYITATIEDCSTRLENLELTLQVGFRLDSGEEEYCTVGLYTASEVEATGGTTSFTGLGRLSSKAGGAYYSENSWPQSISDIIGELAEQAGLEIDTDSYTAAELAQTVSASMDGLLQREALMYIAGLLGGFCTESNTGGIVIRPFSTDVNVTVAPDRSTELYTFGDYDYAVKGVLVQVSEETEYSSGTAANLTLSNPYMTEALFDSMVQRLTGYAYRPATLPISMGDPRLEAGDVISATDTSGNSYTVPCLSLVHNYDGGLMTTVSAPGESETQQDAAFTGSLTQVVERTATKLAVVQELVATKASISDLEATNAQIDNLKSDNADIRNLVAEKADVTDLTAINADIESLQAEDASIKNLVATKADITDLTATNANIDTLTADVANIETLLAGNVGAENLQAIHITGDNVVIDDATITDAMIASLTASKLTAGTIYTSLIKIASDENENLLLDGATLQIKDANGTVRVQLGKDASGDYSYYLWNAEGTLIWSPTGITAGGVPDGIIRNDMVAEDAAIAGSKLDITSVAERLNEDGSLSVDAGQVTIDGTKLDVAYKTVTESVADAQAAADNAQSAADAAQSDATSALDKTTTLETSLSVVQGQIESKVWQSDITEATDALGTRITTVEDQYSTLSQTTDGLSVSVGKLETEVEELDAADSSLQSQITEQNTKLVETAESIVSEATSTLVTQDEFTEYQNTVTTTFTQTSSGFTAEITSAKEELSAATDEKITEATKTSITYSADGNLDLYAVNVRFVDESGEPISYWDGDTLHTGNIYVDTTERAQFGNFAFQPRSDGSLMLVKVGG